MYGGDGFWMFSDPSDPDYLYAEYQGGTVGRVNRYTHQVARHPAAGAGRARSCASTGTRRCISRRTRRARSTSARSSCSARAITARPGIASRRTSRPTTRRNRRQEESGGVTVDNSAAEMHTTIYSISESPKAAGTIWVGTDDGNVQLTRDGGKSWTNTVPGSNGAPTRCQRRRGSAGSRPAALTRPRPTRPSTATPSATSPRIST